MNEPTAGLDFALIAIGRRLSGEKTLEAFGFNPLSDAKDKHMLGEIANIIQHPQGRLKQLVVRENNLISRDETAQVLHYLADTDRGASGSPVCNNDWEPIALHHWGEPALEVTNLLGEPLRSDVNEGVRISAIVQNLRSKASSLQGASSQSLKSLLNVWDSLSRTGPVELAADPAEVKDRRAEAQQGAPSTDIAQRVQPDGAVTWTIPVELSIRLPFQTGGNRQEVRSNLLRSHFGGFLLHWVCAAGLHDQSHARVLGCFDIKRHRLGTACSRSRALNQTVGKISTTLSKYPQSTHHLIGTLHQQLFGSQHHLQRLRYLLSS